MNNGIEVSRSRKNTLMEWMTESNNALKRYAFEIIFEFNFCDSLIVVMSYLISHSAQKSSQTVVTFPVFVRSVRGLTSIPPRRAASYKS